MPVMTTLYGRSIIRSEYVDFIAAYTDLGEGTLGKFKKHDLWGEVEKKAVKIRIVYLVTRGAYLVRRLHSNIDFNVDSRAISVGIKGWNCGVSWRIFYKRSDDQ
ncbi:hypothetical protein Tco_0648076 [Tanacetum coccineum]